MIAHLLGIDSVNSKPYAFWSGSGGYIIQTAAFIAAYWWHHNCHHKGCPRIGKHPHKHFKFCKQHHPLIEETK